MFGHTGTRALVFLESGPEADAFRRARRHASRSLVDVGVDAAAPIPYLALIQAWFRRSTPFGLESSARSLLADRAGVHHREVDAILAGQARSGRDRWTAEHASDPVGRVAVWLCDCGLGRAVFDVGTAPLPAGELLAVGVELVGPCRPAILLDAGPESDPRACRAAAELAGAIHRDAPALPLILASSRPAIGTYLESAPESDTKELVRRGVASWTVDEAPAPTADRSAVADRLREAERHLFRALEADRRTSGRFELCAGAVRPARGIDLMSRTHRLAVALDDPRLASDLEIYRDNRSRYLQLQLDGWVVLGVLADEAIADSAQVVDLLATAMAGLVDDHP